MEKRDLSDSEKMAYAWEAHRTLLEKEFFAERRGCELAEEFTRLEVQIAAVLFAFVGLFIGKIGTGSLYAYLYAAIVFFIVASLTLGLLHLKRKERWWDDLGRERVARVNGWKKHFLGANSFSEALSFDEGAVAGRPQIVRSPLWTWVLQTIALGIAIVLLSWLFIAFTFKPELGGTINPSMEQTDR